jgi:putative ABC transport system permease protein
MNLSFFLETFRLGLNNLHAHKLRSLLTTFGIIFGVLSVITMVAIGEGGKRKTLAEVEQLGSTNIILRSIRPEAGSGANSRRNENILIYGITRGDLQALTDASQEQLTDIVKIVPLRDAGLEVVRDQFKATANAVATTPEFMPVANLSVAKGRFLTDDDMKSVRPVVVLGADVARQLFGAQNALGQMVRLQRASSLAKLFEVVGVMNAVGLAGGKGSALTGRDLNMDVYFPLTANDAMFGDTIMRISAGSRDRQILQLSEIYIRVNAPPNVEPTAAAIDRLMAVRHTSQKDVQVRVPLELLRQAGEQQKLFNFIMVGIACLSLLVGGIGIMNISLATVTERTREIGVRRALGGKRQHIITQFLIETTCLSVAGGIVGVIGGIGLAVLVDWGSSGSYPTHVTVWSVALSFGISASVGILFGLYPAIVAAHKDPIEALRHD